MKKLLLIILLLTIAIFASGKIIKMENDDKIFSVSVGEDYFAIKKQSQDYKNELLIYKLTGEFLYSIKESYHANTDYQLKIREFQISEEANSIIVHYMGSEAFNNQVIVYDLTTGEQKTTYEFVCENISISPSGRYFITAQSDFDNRPSPFKLFDLINGNEIQTNINLKYYRATWIDSIRFVINNTVRISEDEVENQDAVKEFKFLMNEKKYAKNIKDYKLRKQVNAKLKELRKREPLAFPAERVKTAHFMVYNIESHEIEEDKFIYEDNGNKIGRLTLNPDREESLYINCYRNKGKRFCTKLDKSLNKIWTIEGYDHINCFIVNSDNVLLAEKDDKYFIVDENSGEIISSVNGTLKTYLDSQLRIPCTYLYNSKIIIDYKNNSVVIK